MKNESPGKLEIFLLLALRQAARLNSGGEESKKDDSPQNFFSLPTEQLPVAEAEKFERLHSDYQKKSEAEKQKWRAQIENFIGSDEPALDANIHESHIDAALRRELPATHRIVMICLPAARQNRLNQAGIETENSRKLRAAPLEKIVRKTFAAQFVALRDLPVGGSFDRLNGAQLARLIRLAGIREAAYACARIEAVESVTGFLRRFAPEDARAIAAQLNSLPQKSGERLSFAENLVQTALKIEPQPSAMLDLLGIWLVGILLCDGAPERIAYTKQKLPLEVAPRLSEIIETQCRRTPAELQREIGAETELLAEKIIKPPGKINPGSRNPKSFQKTD